VRDLVCYVSVDGDPHDFVPYAESVTEAELCALQLPREEFLRVFSAKVEVVRLVVDLLGLHCCADPVRALLIQMLCPYYRSTLN
jgi:hypothetical protein